MPLIKGRLLDTALTSHQNCSNDLMIFLISKNLTPPEFKTLKHAPNNKKTVIQKADKGNIVVILDKCSYIV